MSDCRHNRLRLFSKDGQTWRECKDCNYQWTEERVIADSNSPHNSHTSFVEGCFGCRMKSVVFGAAAMITRAKSDVVYEKKLEKQLEVDRPAYKRMRRAGMQPKSVLGAAKIEAKAETRFEVESGRLYPGKAAQIDAAVREMTDMTGVDPWKPNYEKKDTAVA